MLGLLALRKIAALVVMLAFATPALGGAGHSVGGARHFAVPKVPLAAALLPCPMSVPCRAERPVTSGTSASNARTSPDATSVAALLPCPDSVPCVPPANPIGLDTDGRVGVKTHRRHSSRHRVRRFPKTHVVAAPARDAAETRGEERAADGLTRRGPRAVERFAPKGSDRTVALAGDGVNRSHAQQLLGQVRRDLGKVGETGLTSENAAVFEQANAFANEGQEALRRQDNLAALTLAKKARLLTASLSSGIAQPAPSAAPGSKVR